ncbi:MAG: hypothetical protein E6929_07805 [Clostridium sp.]|nr:hypothetical protein [Clostridium sp.]
MEDKYSELLSRLEEEQIIAKDLESMAITIQEAILCGNNIVNVYGDTVAVLGKMLHIHQENLKIILSDSYKLAVHGK